MKTASKERRKMRRSPTPNVAIHRQSPAFQRELPRILLRDKLEAFVRKVFDTLRPDEPYLHNWHVELLCAMLESQRQRKRLRKIINLPPRSLKSIIVSVALPAWLLGHDPSLQIIVVSYSDELARKLSRDFRTVVESKWYRDLFPGMILEKATETEITTTRQGCRFATSTGGTLTGRRGGIVILSMIRSSRSMLNPKSLVPRTTNGSIRPFSHASTTRSATR
jgi:hypothetical protein